MKINDCSDKVAGGEKVIQKAKVKKQKAKSKGQRSKVKGQSES